MDNIASVIQNLEMLTKLVDERQYESVMEQRYILLQRELEAAGSNLLLISPSRRLIRNGPMVCSSFAALVYNSVDGARAKAEVKVRRI